MKCKACKYEYKVDYDNDNKVMIGDKPFINIGSGAMFPVRNFPYEDYNVGLYGCPKCQTVRYEKVW